MKTGETWVASIEGLDRFNQDLFLEFQASNMLGQAVQGTLLLEVDVAGRDGIGQVDGLCVFVLRLRGSC